MSEISHEYGATEPTPAEQLEASVNGLFDAFAEYSEPGMREFEETLKLYTSDVFNATPTATWFFVERSIPGKEQDALEKWPHFNGPRIKIHEDMYPGHIETDFWIKDGQVLKRQDIVNPGDRSAMPGETFEGWVGRRSSELFADIISLEALDAASRARSVNSRNYGENIDLEDLNALLEWIKTGHPAQ